MGLGYSESYAIVKFILCVNCETDVTLLFTSLFYICFQLVWWRIVDYQWWRSG